MFKLVSRKRFDELLMSEFVAEDRGRYIEELLSSVADLEAKIAKANEELAGMEAKKKFLQKAAREQEQQDQQKQ